VFAIEEAGGGDEFMAVKPWLGAIKAPTAPADANPSAPRVKLNLEWVYGYRGRESRSNLRYNDAGEIVYHTAGVGVIYNKKNHSQKHYIGHDDDIVSLAIDPSCNFVATGQMGKRPRVRVWDSESGAELCALPVVHRRAVPCLAFSPKGDKLVSVGDDDNHSIAVATTPGGSWTDGKVIAQAKGDRAVTLFATFTEEGEFQIVTGGVKHIKFWKLGSRGVQSKKGLFGKHGKSQPLPSVATLGSKVVTGTVTGHLYVWEGRSLAKAIPAHKGSVNTLYAYALGLVSGSKDGTVRMWSRSLEAVRAFNMLKPGPHAVVPLDPNVRSVCMSADTKTLLVGTAGSEIYEISLDNGSMALLHEAHCADELWGLDTHPKARHLAVTSGDDKTIRVWNLKDHRMERKTVLDTMAHAVLSADSLDLVHAGRDSKEWIQDVKFSPDGSMFAVGSHDNKIRVYDTTGGRFTLLCTANAHQSYITHFDFSADSNWIQSNCGAYELLFFNAKTGEQQKSASALRDVDWATWTCVLGWPVQGIWPEASDGTDINAVARDPSGRLLATADDFGHVRVFNYPCIDKGSEFVLGKGHSSHVTNVRFSADGNWLLTAGGNDRSLFQWRVDA
jgi:microtubule-associated protein-like 6